MDAALHIDLFNIDNDHFEGYKYVLTSPRSLDACSRLGIKPVELLSKSLNDVKEELLPRGVSMRAIYEAFNEQERERLNKLHFCIEERQRIIDESESVLTRQLHNSVERRMTQDDDVVSEEGECCETVSESRLVDRGSLERARTAWTTSIGHDRVSLEELEDRANKLHELGKALDVRSSGHSTRTRMRRRAKVLRPTSGMQSSEETEACRKESVVRRSHSDLGYSSSRRASSQDSLASGHSSIWSGHSSMRSGRSSVRSGHSSIRSGHSSVRSGRSSVRSSEISRTTGDRRDSDVTLITDPQLKKKLKSIIAPDTRLKTKDQKILSLMVAKREEKRHDAALSKATQSMWDEKHARELTAAEVEENRRRQKLATQRRKEHLLKAQIEARRREKEEEETKLRDRQLEETLKISSLSLHRQRQHQIQKQTEKRSTELKKKMLVVARLEEKNRDMDEYNCAILDKQQRDIEHAISIKMTREQQIAMRTRIKNQTSQQKHENKMSEIQRQSYDDARSLQVSLDIKHQQTQEKLTTQQQRKQIQLQEKQRELDEKIEQSKLKQLEMENEVKGWHEKLMNYRRLQEVRADKIAKETVAEKSRKALFDRTEKEKMQQEKMKKLVEDEMQWKRDMKAAIEMKEMRITTLQTEREEMIKQSRSLAGSSQRLRDAVKHKYSTYDLDDLNKQAAHENKFLYKAQYNLNQPSVKNVSNIFLG